MKRKILFILKGLRITPHFSKKLGHNFHTLTFLEMLIYLVFIRPFWSKEKRFLFEGSLGLIGQMYIGDRRGLFETIIERKPRHCFEIGTFTGGGSTFFIASAFERLGTGTLYTLESLPQYYEKAKNYYCKKLPHLAPHVNFLFGSTADAFKPYIPSDGIDCVFFDGAEDAQESVDQYNYFLPFFKKGSVIMMHDWHTEKMALLKPLIQKGPKWRIIKEINLPESIGFAVAEMI